MGANTVVKDLGFLPESEWNAIVAGAEKVELPKVTSTDNGKVLMVVDGKWAVAELPTEPVEVEEQTGE